MVEELEDEPDLVEPLSLDEFDEPDESDEPDELLDEEGLLEDELADDLLDSDRASLR